MREHYDDILCVMSTCPASIAPTLFARGFIVHATLGMATEQSSRTNLDNANKLLRECWNSISTHKQPEERLQELLSILERADGGGVNVAEDVRKVSDFIALQKKILIIIIIIHYY